MKPRLPTLLLPGMDGTGWLFRSFERHLDPSIAPRIVAYPTDETRSYDALVDEVPVPEEPFAIVAESFSGPVGIRLAARHPDRVVALVLVAAFVRRPSLASSLGALVAPTLFRLRPPDIALRAALLGMDATDAEVRELRVAIEAVEAAVMASRLREIARVDARGELAATTAPVLYLAGARDRVVGAGVIDELKALRPDMETRALDAPHLVLQRRPAQAGRTISRFLTRSRAHA